MLKLLTLNINGSGIKHGPWSRRKELIRRMIEQAAPDICAVQAVETSSAPDQPDQARQLAHMLADYPHLAVKAAQPVGGALALGQAHLSRYPITVVKTLRLAHRSDTEDPFERILLHGCFDLPDGPFDVFSAHFSWVESQALDNVHEVLSYVDAISGRRVLLGDLNHSPDAEPMRRLGAAGWEDVWARLRSGEDGFTFESDRPTKRIDYIWVTRELLPCVQAIQVIALDDGDGLRPSDHLGLMATLEI